MSSKTSVQMGLTMLQFIALNEILRHVRLGDQSIYSAEISDMLIAWDKQGLTEAIDAMLTQADKHGIGAPVIRFEYNDDEGMVINVDEECIFE